MADTNVTLAFKDVQVIPRFSMEETFYIFIQFFNICDRYWVWFCPVFRNGVSHVGFSTMVIPTISLLH